MDPELVERWLAHQVTQHLMKLLKKEKQDILEYLGQGGVRGTADEVLQNYGMFVGRIQALDSILDLKTTLLRGEDGEEST